MASPAYYCLPRIPRAWVWAWASPGGCWPGEDAPQPVAPRCAPTNNSNLDTRHLKIQAQRGLPPAFPHPSIQSRIQGHWLSACPVHAELGNGFKRANKREDPSSQAAGISAEGDRQKSGAISKEGGWGWSKCSEGSKQDKVMESLGREGLVRGGHLGGVGTMKIPGNSKWRGLEAGTGGGAGPEPWGTWDGIPRECPVPCQGRL